MEAGKHPMVARLLKGAFHARLTLPQGSFSVYRRLRAIYYNYTLPLKLLTYKLQVIMLLSLTRPSHSTDLALHT